MVPVIGTGALLLAGRCRPESRSVWLMGSPPMRWIGQRSYSWYLWHWPALVVLVAVWPSAGTVTKLGVVVFSLGLSVVTYRFLENPVRRSQALKVRPRVSVSLGVGLALVSLIGAVGMSAAATARAGHGHQLRFANASGDVPIIYGNGCLLSFKDVEPRESCVCGDPASHTTVVLFGDSHAAHWFPALEEIAEQRGWRLEVMVKAGCPSASVPPFYREQVGGLDQKCRTWREKTLDRIVAMDPAMVVMSNASGYVADTTSKAHPVSSSQWSKGLDETFQRLSAAGVPAALIADVPAADVDVPICLSRKEAAWIAPASCNISLNHPAIRELERAAVRRSSGVTLIDMNDQICPHGECGPVKHGEIMYSDENHLTATFSRSLADVLGERLGPIVRARPPSG